MADYPYTPNPAVIKTFFAKIRNAGVPDKVTIKYIEALGFKSKNDRNILTILKSIGMVDAAGTPTSVWKGYRAKGTGERVLAQALKRAYADLFKTYPDADRKDTEALRNFFSAKTSVADTTLGLMVRTFKNLAELADFEGEAPEDQEDEEVEKPHRPIARLRALPLPESPNHPAVNINIQLQLPATEDGTIYEKLFAAMEKHLFAKKAD